MVGNPASLGTLNWIKSWLMQSDECKCVTEFLLRGRRNKIRLDAVYSFRIAMLCFTTYFIVNV